MNYKGFSNEIVGGEGGSSDVLILKKDYGQKLENCAWKTACIFSS